MLLWRSNSTHTVCVRSSNSVITTNYEVLAESVFFLGLKKPLDERNCLSEFLKIFLGRLSPRVSLFYTPEIHFASQVHLPGKQKVPGSNPSGAA